MKPYRRLSPMEWAYLAAADDFPPFAIQLLIESQTLPGTAALEAALQKAAAANVGARLCRSGKWWCDSQQAPRLRSLLDEQAPSADHPVFRTLPMPQGEPPIEVIACRGLGLVFRCAHALMDARGLIFFAEETFRALRGEPLLGTSVVTSDRDCLLAARSSTRRGWPLPNAASPMGHALQSDAGFLWQRRRLDVKNDAVGARLVAAVVDATLKRAGASGSCARIMLPVDLRAKQGIRTTVNLANPLLFEFHEPPTWDAVRHSTLQAIAQDQEYATEALDGWLPAVPLPLVGKVLRYAQRRQVRQNRFCFSSTISHMGRLSLASFRTNAFVPQAVSLLPFDMPGCALMLITTQHDNGFEISASAPAIYGHEQLASTLDLISRQIEASAAPPVSRAGLGARCPPLIGPSQSWSRYETVLDVIDEAAGIHAARVAVSMLDERLSYEELPREVERIAAQLTAQGVGVSDHVALLADRSPHLVAAVLAILFLGAAFVPLDATWPRERTQLVLKDCQPRCVITQTRHASVAGDFSCLLLDGPDARSSQAPVKPRIRIDPRSPAYLLYTSGSTGRPKGVVVSHASLLNYVLWAREGYFKDRSERNVFAFFTSLAFDLTLTTLLLPLVTGGEIRVFPESDPLSLVQAVIADASINSLKLTPSHLRMFAELGIQATRLSTFIVGGEALTTTLARAIVAQSAGREPRIFNEYGPTEATVGCVVHRFDPLLDLDETVPIGLPIANTQIHLLGDGDTVASGEVGEIHIAGDCLALGYLDRPEEDLRFSLHSACAGARVYRTGDLARVDAAGKLLYRGRTDEQVKVRGMRIELGEIEAAIAACGLCEEAAVTFSQGRLRAFVRWRDGEGDPVARLLAALERRLPRYALPEVVTVTGLPLTVNGKVDKTALAALPLSKALIGDRSTPTDALEQKVISIAAEILALPPDSIAAETSLLDLGCDSLQMAMLLSRCARELLPPLQQKRYFDDLRELLGNPTPHRLADRVRRLQV